MVRKPFDFSQFPILLRIFLGRTMPMLICECYIIWYEMIIAAGLTVIWLTGWECWVSAQCWEITCTGLVTCAMVTLVTMMTAGWHQHWNMTIIIILVQNSENIHIIAMKCNITVLISVKRVITNTQKWRCCEKYLTFYFLSWIKWVLFLRKSK